MQQEKNKLYVGNFPFSWTETDIENAFENYRDNIVEIKIIYDQFSGRSKGFAFLTFDSEDTAERALELADSKAGDRNLVVSHARPAGQRRSFDRDRSSNGGGRFQGRNSRGFEA